LGVLATAPPAAPRQATVEIVTGNQPEEIRTSGAVGLFVPGQGLYVSREEALERLGRLPQDPCDPIERCHYEVFVSVPPLGAQPNESRYDVTILGGGFGGVLMS
jgi:hypothetical protein